ncbi:MAG: Hydroxymethylglutaryl-CoA lyase [Pseudomonadota bacterium]|jgi:hydroxymethylglutaryl-CoA lyase
MTTIGNGLLQTEVPLKLWEVGPRDGLQSEKNILSLDAKRDLVVGMMEAGLRHIEVGSFVRAIPQLADTDALFAGLADHPLRKQTTLTGLIFNAKGLERAIAAGVDGVCIVAIPSDTLSQKNAGVGAQEGLLRALALVDEAKAHNLFVRVDLATSWVCPFEGQMPQEKIFEFASALLDKPGVDELALADTIGHAHPLQVYATFARLAEKYSIHRLAAHFHDTQGLALANVTAAMSAGVRIFDSALGGLGGCPFAPGAAGNLATEDLVLMAQKLNSNQLRDVSLTALWTMVEKLEQHIGRPLGGRSRAWWRSQSK